MLNRTFIFLLLTLGGALCAVAEDFRFNHGPYLQNVSSEGAVVYFTTSEKAFSWVEVVCDEWEEPKRFYSCDAGLLQAYNTSNSVEISGLKAGYSYRYRLVAKQMNEFRPYKIVYGDSIATQWESFTTLKPKIDKSSFVVINDGHDNAKKVQTLLEFSSLDSADAVIYLGDMVSHIENADAPYKGFIDVSVEMFARNKPFIAVRGNHETRGNLGRMYGNYVARPNGKYYNIYYYGETALIVLDTGEDKPDTHPVYGGITVFDDYRREQASWLEKEIKSKRFAKTRNRVVFMHIPPIVPYEDKSPEGHAIKELNSLFVPLFNEAAVDLVVSGHTHRHFVIEKGVAGNKFPVVINDHRSVLDLSVEKNDIRVKITDEKGEIILNKNF